jgi:perosamine synthetase
MSKTPAEVFKHSVNENFKFLKSAETIQDVYLRAIPVGKYGYLIPLSKCHKNDFELLEKISRWRNENVEVYPTQFVSTLESTKAWLKDRLLDSEGRILFLVVDNTGKVVGHIGFNDCLNDNQSFEIDNVIKGEQEIPKGVFSQALNALLEWARKTINENSFNLRVMKDNTHAIQFYEKIGFVFEREIPLFKKIDNGVVSYSESLNPEKADAFFLKLVYQPHFKGVGQSLILTAGPSISAKESAYAFDAAQSGWNSNWSKYLTTFEKRFAEYVGVKYALATSSCTGALQIALMSLGIGKGDEVIVPDQTWVATANAVRYVGATPIFADIELDTWNIDIQSIEKLISKNTKAIISVHMYGHPARMTKIMEFAKKHDLKVVEDAAPAIGAEWQGQRCGSFGDFAAFSFQGAKLMVTGEGGMLVTNDYSLYSKALKIWDQGRNPSRAFWIDADGVKFKMSNVQAAIGLGQLERVDELIEMKRRLFSWYQEGLHNTPFIHLNKEVDGARSIYWMSSLRLDEKAPIDRDSLIVALKRANIDSRPVFPAISQYPIWGHRQEPQLTSLRVGAQALNLPSGVCLKKDEVMYVAANIHKILTVKSSQ